MSSCMKVQGLQRAAVVQHSLRVVQRVLDRPGGAIVLCHCFPGTMSPVFRFFWKQHTGVHYSTVLYNGHTQSSGC